MLEASPGCSAPSWLAISSAGAITPAGSVATAAGGSSGVAGEPGRAAGLGKHENTGAFLGYIDEVAFDGERIGCNN